MPRGKRMAAFCLCCFLIGGSCVGLSANATTITRSTDNDPVASGYSYDCYNMTYYSGMPGSYNNDMRLSPVISGNNAYYSWFYPGITVNKLSCTVKLDVYLNNANFTDPKARYYYEINPIEGTSGVMANIGEINQNFAKPGWNTLVKTVSSYDGRTRIGSRQVSVSASNEPNKQLGADGLIVTVTY